MTNLIVITVYNDVMSHIVAGESEVIATSKTQALVVPLLQQWRTGGGGLSTVPPSLLGDVEAVIH